MIAPPPKELLEYLAYYDAPIQRLALETRDFVFAEMAPCVESIVDATNAVALGYGPTDRLKDMVCHLSVYAKYVNIGLNHGAELNNFAELLQGTGRQTRHIRVRSAADLKNPELRKCIRAAYKLADMKQTTRHLHEIATVIKQPYARKRRPNPLPTALSAKFSGR